MPGLFSGLVSLIYRQFLGFWPCLWSCCGGPCHWSLANAAMVHRSPTRMDVSVPRIYGHICLHLRCGCSAVDMVGRRTSVLPVCRSVILVARPLRSAGH